MKKIIVAMLCVVSLRVYAMDFEQLLSDVSLIAPPYVVAELEEEHYEPTELDKKIEAGLSAIARFIGTKLQDVVINVLGLDQLQG